MTRLYQQWPGKNKFYCDGHCITGPDRGSFCCSVILIVIPAALFFPFVAIDAWELLHPAVPIVCGYLITLTLVALFIAGHMDPGIIPRDPSNKLEEKETPTAETGFPLEPTEGKEIIFNGEPRTLRMCSTCKIYKPPRSSHCSTCNNCVDKFDHHCPWVGNCIAKRNYRWFLIFVFGVNASLLSAFGTCAGVLVKLGLNSGEGDNFQAFVAALKENPFAAIVGVYSFFVFWSIAGLAGYHIFLVSIGETTNENLKGVFMERTNPYSRGCCGNWFMALCGPMYPSYFNLRAVVKHDTRVQGSPHQYHHRHQDLERQPLT